MIVSPNPSHSVQDFNRPLSSMIVQITYTHTPQTDTQNQTPPVTAIHPCSCVRRRPDCDWLIWVVVADGVAGMELECPLG